MSKVPAVVVGGTLNSLGVVRSLARGHMPIYVVESNRQCAARWSRYCRLVTTSSLEGPALIDVLLALASRLACRPVLILTTDQSVNTVSACLDRVLPAYRIGLPSAEMVLALSDKTAFQALAEREGFAVPRAVAVWAAEG